jgi:hypothetical protein
MILDFWLPFDQKSKIITGFAGRGHWLARTARHFVRRARTRLTVLPSAATVRTQFQPIQAE